ncbi:MAG: hypothetical protein ACD_46C00100G0004 [uncultured bacterium]|nr:MAG: hypothetical protein ACD_46C00100G0004 [uncultured bacterium]
MMKSISIKQLLYNAQEILSTVSATPLLDAEILLAHTLNQPRSFLHAHIDEMIAEENIHLFVNYLERRHQREPIAYIVGQREFWSLPLDVSPDVLIPRADTELLVETVLQLFPHRNLNLADLGTGSGAIALAFASECPAWKIVATDISKNALQIAKKNAQQLLLHHVSFYQGSWCDALPTEKFDVIVSNPPYIAETEWESYADDLLFEPRLALVADRNGLAAIDEICETAPTYLKSGGFLLIEHGFLQGESVREIFKKAGFNNVYTLKDLAGHERVSVGQYAID